MHRVLKPVTLEELTRAQERLEGHVLHSPMVKLKWRRPEKNGGQGGPEIYLKLENLQPINRQALLSKNCWIESKFTILRCNISASRSAVQ